MKDLWIAEFALIREREQLVVRHRGPQKIRQPRCQRVFADGLFAGFVKKQKSRRTQNAFESQPQGLFKRSAIGQCLLDQIQVGSRFGGVGRPAERAGQHAAQDGFRVRQGSLLRIHIA